MGVAHDSEMMSSKMRKGVKTDLPIFRERLHEALKDLDMSQRQLALQMGKDPRTINHVFTGPVHPDLGTLRDLCARLNVSADYLLGLGEKTEPTGGGKVIKHYEDLRAAFSKDGEASHIGVTTLPNWDNFQGDIIAFKMNGENLNHPIIEDGDILYVDTGQTTVATSGFYINEDKRGRYWVIYIVTNSGDDGEGRNFSRVYFEGTRGAKQVAEPRAAKTAEYFNIKGKVISRRTEHFL